MAAAPARPRVGLALMPEPEFARACAPLFDAGLVDVVEWSFDTIWRAEQRPPVLQSQLRALAASGSLLGHGVMFSLLSAGADARQQQWLGRLAQECSALRYERISEHFGFVTAGAWQDSAPLPPPPGETVVALGRDRLARIAEACGVPVGLENLAFAFGLADVEREGEMLESMLEPVDGFVVLDLHNLWCRAVNFQIPATELLRRYPLHRVRELHVSGGSWNEAHGRRIRRDTHDGGVPEEVQRLLPSALAACPRVDSVILEHLGSALDDEAAVRRLRTDFLRVRALCHGPFRL